MKRALIDDQRPGRICQVENVGNDFEVDLPLHWEDCPDECTDHWEWTGNEAREKVLPLEELRDLVKDHIDTKMLSLTSGRIAALDNKAMIELMAEIWPHLNNPASNPDLDYAKDVVLKARTLRNQANSADRATLEAFDVDNPPGGWPT